MDMFAMMKQAMNLKNRVHEIQTQLAQQNVVVDKNGMQISLSCDLKSINCVVTDEAVTRGSDMLSRQFTEVVQETLTKAKQKATDELKGAMGGLDLGGLLNLLK